MSDDSLRRSLAQVNSTAIAIQTAAAALMKHYDRTVHAVNAWRNAVVEAKHNPQSLLALVYVANEVLQTSKRNRGNAFLEAFAPILAPTLVYLAEQGVPVEKLRRVVKIWGDRRVFSVRFVQDVLGKLERFRGKPAAPVASPPPSSSPPQPTRKPSPISQQQQQQDGDVVMVDGDDNEDANSGASAAGSDASITDILNSHGRSKDEDDDNDDDDDDLFGGSDRGAKLDVEINLDLATAAAAASHHKSTTATSSRRSSSKRRRNSGGRPADRSMNRLLDLWKSLVENQQRCDLATHAMDRITKQLAQQEDVSTLVGDDLQRAARLNNADLATLYAQRKELYQLANERHAIEQEAMSYVTWLEQALVQDAEEILSAVAVLEQLGPYQPVHRALQQQYRADTAAAQAAAEAAAAAEQARQQKAAQQAFQAAALAKETEAKPGMVWNPTTREYVTLDTDESWRD